MESVAYKCSSTIELVYQTLALSISWKVLVLSRIKGCDSNLEINNSQIS